MHIQIQISSVFIVWNVAAVNIRAVQGAKLPRMLRNAFQRQLSKLLQKLYNCA